MYVPKKLAQLSVATLERRTNAKHTRRPEASPLALSQAQLHIEDDLFEGLCSWCQRVGDLPCQVMEWEEFTGFVIDQVLSLTREAPLVDRLKARSVGACDTPSISR